MLIIQINNVDKGFPRNKVERTIRAALPRLLNADVTHATGKECLQNVSISFGTENDSRREHLHSAVSVQFQAYNFDHLRDNITDNTINRLKAIATQIGADLNDTVRVCLALTCHHSAGVTFRTAVYRPEHEESWDQLSDLL